MENKISDNSTIYNYTLVKKIPYAAKLITIYITLPVVLAICHLILFQLEGLLSYIICGAAVYLLLYGLTRMSLKLRHDPSRGSWRHQWNIPCTGYLPTGFVSVHTFQQLHIQLLFVGIASITLCYVWLPQAYIVNLICFHLWLLLPRLLLIRKFTQLKKIGFVKFNKQDSSFYVS